jgi:hypothetical protein
MTRMGDRRLRYKAGYALAMKRAAAEIAELRADRCARL